MVSPDCADRVSLMPAEPASDSRSCMMTVCAADPLAYFSWKLSASPFLMPAPHSPALVPGLTQVPGLVLTSQPLAVSSCLALVMLKGYWSFTSAGFRTGLLGRAGTPVVVA